MGESHTRGIARKSGPFLQNVLAQSDICMNTKACTGMRARSLAAWFRLKQVKIIPGKKIGIAQFVE
jgi:hypothetical protein